MATEVPTSRLSRSNVVKRKRSDFSHELKDALKRLRQATDRLSTTIPDLPNDIHPLVELLQTQTTMIEAFASNHEAKLHNQHVSNQHATPDRGRREHVYHPKHNCQHNTSEETSGTTHVNKSRNSPAWADTPVSPEQNEQGTKEVFLHHRKIKIPEISIPAYSPHCKTFHTAEIVEVPPSPPISPPPPPLPPKDAKYTRTLNSKPSWLTINTNVSGDSRCSSRASSVHTVASCTTCDFQPWHLLDRPDPRDSDFTCESHVQEATSSLIANMKEKKRTPIGPLDGGTFNLYSADYRKHYCAHDRPERQSLLVYSKSKSWESDFPGVPAPVAGEVAMELVVYPDCLLIVKPFKVPKHAGWKWHTLDAIGDNARPTTIEVMFLGNGFLKVRVRLSELLGEEGMEEGEPDRFIEFAGIWSAGLKVEDEDETTSIYESGMYLQEGSSSRDDLRPDCGLEKYGGMMPLQGAMI